MREWFNLNEGCKSIISVLRKILSINWLKEVYIFSYSEFCVVYSGIQYLSFISDVNVALWNLLLMEIASHCMHWTTDLLKIYFDCDLFEITYNFIASVDVLLSLIAFAFMAFHIVRFAALVIFQLFYWWKQLVCKNVCTV